MYIIPDITLRKRAAENNLQTMNTHLGKVGEKKQLKFIKKILELTCYTWGRDRL